MYRISILLFSCILISITSCAGIKLSNNCEKQINKTFIVLPFVGHDYACNFDVENKIRNLCYNVENGLTILNEYSRTFNKSYTEISIEEFCDFAKTEGIDYIVIGNVRTEWFEGPKPTRMIESPSSNYLLGSRDDNSRSKSLEENMYNIVTGNYAVVDCYRINTNTKDKKNIFRNYKMKKLPTGMPSSF